MSGPLRGSNPAWGVTGDDRSVTAWSRTRLAFEPRGDMLEFRGALRAALKALRPVSGEGLVASYSSPNDEFVDVENAALYNVGAGAYGHLTPAGLYCERLISPDERHHLWYAVGPLPAPQASEPLARLSGAVPSDTHAPGPWWAHVHPQVEVLGRRDRGPFSLDVVLTGTWAGTRVANVVKPMLDGLVSALHRHDGSGRDDLLPRLRQLGEPSAVWSALCTPDHDVLGTRRLVRAHGAAIAWNPADERCHAFRVRAVPGPSAGVVAEASAV